MIDNGQHDKMKFTAIGQGNDIYMYMYVKFSK